jgi:glycosyltransferase involved in cell wall biosynthesis
MISVVIPVHNQFDITRECVHQLLDLAERKMPIEVIVVDNASDEVFKHPQVKVLRQDTNIGYFPAVLKGIEAAENNIVACIHSDVIIWEPGYDTRIAKAFDEDDLLGIAGFFGGRGVAPNGGRCHPEGNMLARKYGTPQNQHGFWQRGIHSAVVFDSLAMIFNREHLNTLVIDDIPPHHWCDRLITLRMVQAGFHAATLGIGFDHGGGFTSGNSISTFAKDYCEQFNISPLYDKDRDMMSYDLGIYKRGESMFKEELATTKINGNEIGHNVQLWANHDYRLFGMRQG